MKIRALNNRKVLKNLFLEKGKTYDVEIKCAEGYIVKIKSRKVIVGFDECEEINNNAFGKLKERLHFTF